MSDDEKPKPKTYRPSQLIKAAYDDVKLAFENREKGIPNGPSVSCFPQVSEQFGGSPPIGVTGLLGAPGCGKSCFVGQLADGAECPTLIVTFEMTPLDLLQRSAARMTSTPISSFHKYLLPPEVWLSHVTKAAQALDHLRYLDGTTCAVEPRDVLESLTTLRGESRHAFLVVDSVSAWARAIDEGSLYGNLQENDRVGKLLRDVQKIALGLKISAIAVGEQNRAGRNSDTQESGARTSAWEYATEAQITLQKPKGSELDKHTGNRDIDVTLVKNRRGIENYRIPMRFEGGYQRFVEKTEKQETNLPVEEYGETGNGHRLPPGRKHVIKSKALT